MKKRESVKLLPVKGWVYCNVMIKSFYAQHHFFKIQKKKLMNELTLKWNQNRSSIETMKPETSWLHYWRHEWTLPLINIQLSGVFIIALCNCPNYTNLIWMLSTPECISCNHLIMCEPNGKPNHTVSKHYCVPQYFATWP